MTEGDLQRFERVVLPHLDDAYTLARYLLRDERMSRMLLAALAFPVFLLLGLVATVRAIGRQVTRQRTWAKTERLSEEPAAARLRPVMVRTTAPRPNRPPRRRARARQLVRARRPANGPKRRRTTRT